MPNILSDSEAADWVRSDASDTAMLQLLPLVDQYLLSATGRDWSADSTIHPLAKTAAGIILVSWYDDPGQIGTSPSRANGPLLQLEVEALKYRKYTFIGLSGAGSISIPGAKEGDDVIKLIGVHGVSDDQSADFESEISSDGYLQQTSGSNLSSNIYVVVLKSPDEDVTA